MFDRAVEASEAMCQGAGCKEGMLIPAFCGCIPCGTRRMIAVPVLGTCERCGGDLTIVASAEAVFARQKSSQLPLVA
jgi:hypothetical protein